MPTATINVVRYSALSFGVLYGIVHRRSLQSHHDAQKVKQEVHKREEWVKEARKAWQTKVLERSGAGGVISDPENPAFDLEAFLNNVASQS